MVSRLVMIAINQPPLVNYHNLQMNISGFSPLLWTNKLGMAPTTCKSLARMGTDEITEPGPQRRRMVDLYQPTPPHTCLCPLIEICQHLASRSNMSVGLQEQMCWNMLLQSVWKDNCSTTLKRRHPKYCTGCLFQYVLCSFDKISSSFHPIGASILSQCWGVCAWQT